MTNKDANYTDNYVRTPSIHISENPLSETSLNSLIIESSKISYATVKDQTSLKSGQDGGTNSPLGLANGLDIAGSNNQCHRINRLLSIGPEFHIQIKNPTSIEFMNWNSKTGAEKRLICIILLMLILFPVFLLITTHIINRKGLLVHNLLSFYTLTFYFPFFLFKILKELMKTCACHQIVLK